MATENLPPQVLVRVLRELQQLALAPPDGVRYTAGDEDTLSEIMAEVDGPEDTPYEGGVFTVKLVLGDDYPSAPPRGFFLTRIYHPNVSSNGDICVNTLKRDWSPSVTLKHILQVIRCLLIVPFPESSLNDEAGRLFMDSYEEYARRARLMTQVHAASGARKESPQPLASAGDDADDAEADTEAKTVIPATTAAPTDENDDASAPAGDEARAAAAAASVEGAGAGDLDGSSGATAAEAAAAAGNDGAAAPSSSSTSSRGSSAVQSTASSSVAKGAARSGSSSGKLRKSGTKSGRGGVNRGESKRKALKRL